MAEVQTTGETGGVISALIAVQKELEPLKANATSHHGKFANLAGVMDALQPLLSKNRLAVVQMPVSNSGACSLQTRIIHEDKSEVSSTITIPLQRANDPQAYGAAMTYGRRYALLCMFGMVTEDDDAASASTSLEKILRELCSATDMNELSQTKARHTESGLLGTNKFWSKIYMTIHDKMYAALSAQNPTKAA